jgi:ABC-type phosphate transport system substrate-binding protein
MNSTLFSSVLVRLIIVIGLAMSLNSRAAQAEVVPVVSTQNPVTTLSKYQVVDIFLGKTNRFPDGSEAVAIGFSGAR